MAQEERTFFYRYAPTATGTSYVFGKCDRQIIPQGKAIATSGSSTTTTDPNSTSAFFAAKVGDILLAQTAYKTRLARRISAKASADSITVGALGADTAAWDLGTGLTSWELWPFTSGTTASDGWVDVSRFGPNKTVHVIVTDLTGVTGGFNVIIQGRGYGEAAVGGTPLWLYGPVNYASVNANTVTDQRTFVIGEDIAAIRVGLTAGSVAGAASEITVKLLADVRAR